MNFLSSQEILLLTSDGPSKFTASNVLTTEDLLPIVESALGGFFDTSKDYSLINFENLVFSRIRPEGVKEASSRIKKAMLSQIEKRTPISVSKMPDGRYLIDDGNSTVFCLYMSGFRVFPCKVSEQK